MMGRILVPNREIITPPDRVFQCPTLRLGGKFRCQTHKYKSGTLKYDTGWFNNLITDSGLGYLAHAPVGGSFGQQVAMWNNCSVGTGSGTPAVGDTGLFTFLTQVGEGQQTWSNSTGNGYVPAAGSVPAYYWGQNKYTFPTGQAAGNLTEIGVYPAGVTHGNGLFSHALIVDVNGNPTSITVLPDEVLSVTYQCNFYIDVSDHAFSFPLNGVTNSGTYRTFNLTTAPAVPDGNWAGGGSFGSNTPLVGFYSGDIGTINGSNAGSAIVGTAQASSKGYIDFVNDLANSGTWYFDYQETYPTTTTSNTILSMQFSLNFIKYQFGLLTTPIVKSAGQQMQVSFRGSWGRYP